MPAVMRASFEIIRHRIHEPEKSKVRFHRIMEKRIAKCLKIFYIIHRYELAVLIFLAVK